MIDVDPRGAAKRAGVLKGDLVAAINGKPVATVDDIHRFLSQWAPENPIILDIYRTGKLRHISLVPTGLKRHAS